LDFRPRGILSVLIEAEFFLSWDGTGAHISLYGASCAAELG
jgi:hypothetical protein